MTNNQHIDKNKIECFYLCKENFSTEQTKKVYNDFFTFVLILDGTAIIKSSDLKMKVTEQSLIHFTPYHHIDFEEISNNFNAMCLIMEKRYISELPSIKHFFAFALKNKLFNQFALPLEYYDFNIVYNCIKKVEELLNNKYHHYKQKLMIGVVETFMFELLNILTNAEQSEEETDNTKRVLRLFLELLYTHYREEHLVPFYADKLNISAQYLTLIVKSATGESVSSLVYDLLYNDARMLLKSSDLSIKEIADNLHFSDQSAFGKFFKKKAGISPVDFRKESKKEY